MELDRDVEQSIRAKSYQYKIPLPDYIKNAPVLLPGLELYHKAFIRLNTCRSVGMGPGPIPWTSIRQYGIMQELSQDQLDALHHHISVLDEAYLEWSVKKNGKSD